ncbi:MAG: DNA mismatch repair endonuclease MutL [Clostridiaceae bacterium]
MSKINVLSPETASKIAAGEVVEKPSSVVKEMVENSIDAHSDNIIVEIVNGGLDLIKITDDGVGIRNDDLSKAFMPHATSKIKDINDIFNIRSLGFRGEALASVAAVSKTLLKSKSADDRDGMEIYIEGGEEKYITYSPISKGTMVEVRELFWNVPARLKFLKNPQKEGSSVNDIMLRLALSYPSVSITYINNDKQIFKTYGTGNLLDVIRAVYNKRTADNVMYFENQYEDFKIHGYIGNEELSRGTRSQETLIINGRYVNSRAIAIAVENAFKSFITVSKFPFFVLNIDLNPQSIDVNVHPQKAEVKFEDERLMFTSVFETVHKALREFYKDKLDFESFKLPYTKSDIDNETMAATKPFFQNDKTDFGFKFSDRDINGLVKESGSSETYHGIYTDLTKESIDEILPGTNEIPSVNEVSIPVDLKSPSVKVEEAGYTSPEGDDNSEKFPMPQVIGQFNKTYILAEHNSSLYLFDQHACHEKINFEKYVKEIESRHIIVQPLLAPYIMDLTMEDYMVYMDNKEVFMGVGFTIEDFGDRSISIREVPYFLGKTDLKSYFTDILDNLKNLGKGTTKEVKYLRIATAACKASIKANDKLSIEEMTILLNELRFLKEPFTCPHGRPTMIRFPLADLEKQFRRRM